jgi:hypothetical protein
LDARFLARDQRLAALLDLDFNCAMRSWWSFGVWAASQR